MRQSRWSRRPLQIIAASIIEGLTWAEAQEKHPEVLQHWLEDRNQPPPGGESASAFTARVQSLIDDLLARLPPLLFHHYLLCSFYIS